MHTEVFISHQAEQASIAQALHELLRDGLNLPHDSIYCTSVEHAGVNLSEDIAASMLDAMSCKPFVVILWSDSYLMSQYCVAELGAAWGLKLEYAIFAHDDCTRAKVGGVNKSRLIGSFSAPTHLEQLRSKIEEHIGGRIPIERSRWPDKRELFLKTHGASAAPASFLDAVQILKSGAASHPPFWAGINNILEDLNRGLGHASRFAMLFEKISFEVRDWKRQAQEWSIGQLSGGVETTPVKYQALLNELYEQAQETICSTCVDEYIGLWASALGRNTLDIHRSGKAKVQRLFLLREQAVIDDIAASVLGSHAAAGIDVRLVFLEEHHKQLGEDFTIIDGNIVGVTEFGRSGTSANWYFGTESIIEKYKQRWREFWALAIPLEKWLATPGGNQPAKRIASAHARQRKPRPTRKNRNSSPIE